MQQSSCKKKYLNINRGEFKMIEDNKIEIYEFKNYEFYGSDVKDRVKHGSDICAEELLNKYEIPYYEIEDTNLDGEEYSPCLKVTISVQLLKR